VEDKMTSCISMHCREGAGFWLRSPSGERPGHSGDQQGCPTNRGNPEAWDHRPPRYPRIYYMPQLGGSERTPLHLSFFCIVLHVRSPTSSPLRRPSGLP